MKRYILMFFLITGLLFLSLRVLAQRFILDEGRNKDAVNFEMIQNLIVIPIYINGSGPFNFILDTGVEPLVVTDPSLSNLLEVSNFPLYRMRGRGVGPEIEAYVVNNLTARIGDASMVGFSGIILKDDPFQLSAYMGTPIHGIIGSSFFSSFVVRIDYVSKKVRFYKSEQPPRKRGLKIPIEIIRGKPYMNVEIISDENKKDTLLLLIDSGAGHAISLDLTEDESWIKPKKTIAANLGVGLGGPIQGLIGRLREIKLGDFSLKKVIASFPEYKDENLRLIMTDRDGAIGGEILKRFTVIFDYSREEMHLRKNRNFKKPFEHDMSGMEIYRFEGKDKRFFISRIVAGSPADSAGVLANDEILSINFKEVEHYSLNDIHSLLQKETKGNLVLEILREDQILYILLRLKRSI